MNISKEELLMSTTNLNASKKLSDFLSFYDEAINSYKYYYDKVNECDKLKCDLLHKIELGQFADRNEEKRIQTQLKYCLKDRRYYKDRVEELEPFAMLFLSKEKDKEHITKACTMAINQMRSNCLGSIRRAEEYHRERTYKPRILKDLRETMTL
jgi:hypothetical protein